MDLSSILSGLQRSRPIQVEQVAHVEDHRDDQNDEPEVLPVQQNAPMCSRLGRQLTQFDILHIAQAAISLDPN